jgi:tetratricopeptide (TPR) repeat protein
VSIHVLLIGAIACLAWCLLLWVMKRHFKASNRAQAEIRIRELCDDNSTYDAELCKLIERYPESSTPGLFYANNAMLGKDWAEAVRRWAELRRRFPRFELAYANEYNALKAAGAMNEANALAEEALRRFGLTVNTCGSTIDSCRRKEDYEGLLKVARWLRKAQPDWPVGYLHEIEALLHMRRDAEAQTSFEQGIERCPKELRLRQEFAAFLRDRAEFAELARVAAGIRESFPTDASGYLLGAEAARGLDRPDDAATLLRTARFILPKNDAIRGALAELGITSPEEEAGSAGS